MMTQHKQRRQHQLPMVKICGMTNADLAVQTVKLGADFIGLIFHPASVRAINLEKAKPIASAVKHAGGQLVAVFAEADSDMMQNYCEQLEIQYVQLHGYKARAHHQQLAQDLHRIYVIPIDDTGHLDASTLQFMTGLDKTRDFLLFDYHRGGSGQRISLANVHKINEIPFFIAGGLNPDNVSQVIRECQPAGVDVSSGVESAPGKKDLELIKAFIQQVKII